MTRPFDPAVFDDLVFDSLLTGGILEGVAVTEAMSGIVRHSGAIGEGIGVAPLLLTSVDEVAAADAVQISGALAVSSAWGVAAADEVQFSELAGRAMEYAATVAQTMRVIGSLAPTPGYARALADAVSVQVEALPTPVAVLFEALRIAQTQAAGWTLGVALSDTSRVSGMVVAHWLMTASDAVTVADALAAVQAAQVIEALGIAETLPVTTLFGRSFSDTIRLADSLANFFGGELLETVGLASALLGVTAAPATISETVGVSDASSPQLILRLVAADTMSLDDVDALQMLYAPRLADEIELSAAYLSPGDGITTWAMNTRTGAVTEYSGYAFNSFARTGKKYLGASADGLYELTGDTDDGAAIIARIKSGFAQFAGTRLAMFKGVYLGVRGEGDFILRLITGEGAVCDYAVSTRDMRSTRVHMGKGLRARYFAFELTSAGQDFDLDSIEFVPLAADRRV